MKKFKTNADKPRVAGRKKGHKGSGRKKLTNVDVVKRRGASWFEFTPRALHCIAIGDLPVVGPVPA